MKRSTASSFDRTNHRDIETSLTLLYSAGFGEKPRIRVHEMGPRAYNAYRRFFSVRWASMTEAQTVSLLTLEYLRVRTTEPGVELVIPLFLSEQAQFERLVAKLAGPLNPMSRHFRESDRSGR